VVEDRGVEAARAAAVAAVDKEVARVVVARAVVARVVVVRAAVANREVCSRA
jgi:hypothetical protein